MMKRRQFLTASSLTVGVPMMLNGMGLNTISRSKLFNAINMDNDRVLVLINLVGGNDGLATIIPMESFDNLANHRQNIFIPQNQLLDIGDNMALHPSMTGLRELYDNAKVNIIHDVGYPDQNRSHFRSTDIWTSGSPAAEEWTSGWLGRFFDLNHPGFPTGYPNEEYEDPIAMTMGAQVSSTCQGAISNFSLAVNDPYALTELASGGDTFVPNNYYGSELQFLRTAVEQTNAYSETIVDAANSGSNMVDYPDTNIANQLKNIALLISGGLKTKVYVANIGGFDTHADQVDSDSNTVGQHANLLQAVSDALNSFQNDLDALGLSEKVVGMTFSEFGRRIKSNDSLGTDHGSAAPLIVFGNCINPGFMGDPTTIPDQVEVFDGVEMQFDFRDVYGSILMDWFEVEEDTVKELLYTEFNYMPILNPCFDTNTKNTIVQAPIDLTCYPNPVSDNMRISFDSIGEQIQLSVLDMQGRMIKQIMDRSVAAGTHQLNTDLSNLRSGAYILKLSTDKGRQMNKKFMKL